MAEAVVCTIIARNYLPYARVLARSLEKNSPELSLAVLILDAEDSAWDAEHFRVMTPSEVGLDRREFHRLATIYSVLELATAVKPWLMARLLDEGCEPVLYLDPDIEVSSDLSELTDEARRYGIVLTPHTLEPMSRDGLLPSEHDILISGVYNLGFIAVSSRARPFLGWWRERLKRECLHAVESGLFVDQRWIDMGVVYFAVHVNRDPGCNVAYWNLDQRRLSSDGEGVLVNGVPLKFFHFSGFRPDDASRLSVHQRDLPRIVPADDPILAELCESYASQLIRHGFREEQRRRYPYDVAADGTPLDSALRRSYLADLLAAEGLGRDLPDPFDPAEARAFGDWVRSVRGQGRRHGRGLAFAQAKARRLVRRLPLWAQRPVRAVARYAIKPPTVQGPAPTLPPSRRVRAPRSGVNVIGYFAAESGVGTVARAVTAALGSLGIPYSVVRHRETLARQDHHLDSGIQQGAPFGTNIICVNADALPSVVEAMGPELFRSRYNIGIWAWEVEAFPRWMHGSAEWLDEVWVYSEHAAGAIAPHLLKPVLRCPVPVIVAPSEDKRREELGLPAAFTFLFVFDYLSVFERKNPTAAVRAFKQAFGTRQDVHLVIKSVNADLFAVEHRRLLEEAAGSRNITIRDGYLSSADQHAMIQECEAYVSLHRAEGFGLTLAEAMAFGKPVIATGYSGNLDFMDQWNSYLVPGEMVRIPPGCEPYPEGSWWAEPDLEVASELMVSVFDDYEKALARGSRAAAYIRAKHSVKVLGEFLERRAEAFTDGRARSGAR